MKIDIKKVAKLANLPLTEDEESLFQGQLENIVHFVEKLNEVDTSSVKPTYQVTGKVNELREDTPTEPLTVENVTKNAKRKDGNYIVTKGVFDE